MTEPSDGTSGLKILSVITTYVSNWNYGRGAYLGLLEGPPAMLTHVATSRPDPLGKGGLEHDHGSGALGLLSPDPSIRTRFHITPSLPPR